MNTALAMAQCATRLTSEEVLQQARSAAAAIAERLRTEGARAGAFWNYVDVIIIDSMSNGVLEGSFCKFFSMFSPMFDVCSIL